MRFVKNLRSRVLGRLSPGRWGDLILIVCGAAMLLVLIIVGERASFLAVPRAMLAVPYLLFVPGYCLTLALFPRKSDLDGIERLALSLGLSLAMVAVLAPILDQLPSGIQLWSILGAEYIVTAAFAVVALRRRARLEAHDASTPRPAGQLRPWWRSLAAFERRLMLLSSGFLLVALFSLTWIMIVPSPKSFMTEFYILGAGGMAEDYTTDAIPGGQMITTVGITNRERDERTYDIEMWLIDPWEPEHRERLARVDAITLAPGQGYEQAISWRIPMTVGDQQVEFWLLDGKTVEPYRRLRLWINVPAASSGH